MAITMSITTGTQFANQAAQMQMYAYQQQQMQMLQGGCFPQQNQWGPPQNTWNQNNYNLTNAAVGSHGFLNSQTTNGFALDTNGSGRYEAGQDGVLAMDLNRDGRISPQEIEKSRNLLNAFNGNFDINGDGRTTPCEQMQGRGMQGRARQMLDPTGDGRISAGEFANAGGRVLVDQNRDGKFQPWENSSPFNFPQPGFGRGRLNGIDPFWGSSNITRSQPNWGPPVPPWGGGGYFGGGGGGGQFGY